jgi:UDP-N-acetylglucosamine--N-acetylmuramyl-(pentapeptide) pyrophosphoryl-undecaprenol N-acetylglucosamine transferase
MRLLYSCSELGLGHASRTLALGKQLESRGHEVHFFTGGRAHQLLEQHFNHVYPATPVSWYENAHGIITTASLLNILLPLPVYNNDKQHFEIKSSSTMETTHRYYDLRRRIKEIKPSAIVSDADIHALRLANRWHFPSVYITNLIRPTIGFNTLLNPGERFTERYVRNSTKIIIPDNPPLFTISEYNIGNTGDIGIDDKTEFVGSFVNTTPVKGTQSHVFVPISGPFGTRAKLTNTIIPALQELDVKSVVSLGVVGVRKTVKTKNLTIHTWLSNEERQEAMRNARVVVISGGHGTCFETVRYRKPTVCVPTQPEQLANGTKLQNLGCSIVARNKQQVKQALRRIEERTDDFRSCVENLNRVSNKHNGIERAVQIIESVA